MVVTVIVIVEVFSLRLVLVGDGVVGLLGLLRYLGRYVDKCSRFTLLVWVFGIGVVYLKMYFVLE